MPKRYLIWIENSAERMRRELDLDAAQTMLTATLRWRDEMKIDEIMAEQFPDDVFAGVGRMFGHDKGNRPVV